MLARTWEITGTILPYAAAFALAAGCSSSSSAPDPAVRPQPEDRVVAASHETRDDARANTQGGAAQVAQPDSPGATAQHSRETTVMSKPPPLTRSETPSRQIRDTEFWVAGYWFSESGEYVWQPGRIEQDRKGQLYVPASWVPTPRGWEFTPEHWR